jgi:hypothetical protein
MKLMRLVRLCAGLTLLLTFGIGTLPAFAQPVLSPGTPPLTQQTVDKFDGFLEWLLDAPMTEDQRLQSQQTLVAAWTAKNKYDMDQVTGIANLRDQFATQPDSRALLQPKMQSDVLTWLRGHPDDALSVLLTGLYNSAHAQLAPGSPPLTRQMSEAYLEFIFFAADQIDGATDQPTPGQKDAWANTLTNAYSTFSPDQQQQLSQMPAYWAALRATWPGLSDADRATYKQQWMPVARALLAPASDQPTATPTPADQTAATPSADASATLPPLSDSDVVAKLTDHGWLSQLATNFASTTWLNRLVSVPSISSGPTPLTYTYGWN